MLCTLPPVDPRVFAVEEPDEGLLEKLHESVTYIMADEKQLYGLNAFTGRFGEVSQAGIQWQDTRLDVGVIMQAGGFPSRIAPSMVHKNYLCGLVEEFSFDSNLKFTWYIFDLFDGSARKVDRDDIVTFCLLDTDHLLLLVEEEGGLCFARLELDTGEVHAIDLTLRGIPQMVAVGGIASAQGGRSIYVSAGRLVYRSENGKPFTIFGVLAEELLEPQQQGYIMPDGRYGLLHNPVVSLVSQDDLSDMRRLTVLSGTLPHALCTTYTKKYPAVSLTHIPSVITAEKLAEALLTQDDSIDIFTLRVDHAYTTIKEKGFLADLSTSDNLNTQVALLAPEMQAVLKDSFGNVRAYPYQLKVWRHGFRQGFWDLAFANQALPTSYEDMLSAWLLWETQFAQTYPEIEFVEAFDYAHWCEKLLTAFAMQYDDHPGSLPDFKSNSLRSQLKMLERIVAARRKNGTSINLTPEEDMAWSGKASIYTSRMYDALQKPIMNGLGEGPQSFYDVPVTPETWVPFSFMAGDTHKTDAHLYVYVVNPYANNMKQALDFLESASLQESDPMLYEAIHLSSAKRVENPAVRALIETQMEEKTLVEEAIRRSGDNNTHELELHLNRINVQLEELEAQRWIVSDADIERSRELPRLDFHENSLLIGDSGNSVQNIIRNFCERYAQGQMSLDELINEVDRTTTLIMKENYQ